jgi:hypothetical protein
MMTISDALQSVHFAIDQSGEPTAAVVNMPAREAFLKALEDIIESGSRMRRHVYCRSSIVR